MTWEEIMAIKDPNRAMLEIVEKAHNEKLPIDEAVAMIELYAEKHNTTPEQMAYYPNGENVIC